MKGVGEEGGEGGIMAERGWGKGVRAESCGEES